MPTYETCEQRLKTTTSVRCWPTLSHIKRFKSEFQGEDEPEANDPQLVEQTEGGIAAQISAWKISGNYHTKRIES